jgi:hypothetical protein
MLKYSIDNDFVTKYSFDGKRKTQIKIDKESEEYKAIKIETNNFTENMDFPPTVEEKLQSDIDYLAIMMGVDLSV